jgi:hypothetical protein
VQQHQPCSSLRLVCCCCRVFQVVHLGRQPKPKDLVGRILYSLGGVMRGLGTALDTVGSAVQGPYAVEDKCK